MPHYILCPLPFFALLVAHLQHPPYIVNPKPYVVPTLTRTTSENLDYEVNPSPFPAPALVVCGYGRISGRAVVPYPAGSGGLPGRVDPCGSARRPGATGPTRLPAGPGRPLGGGGAPGRNGVEDSGYDPRSTAEGMAEEAFEIVVAVLADFERFRIEILDVCACGDAGGSALSSDR